MKKIIIREGQVGLIFKNGKFEKVLDAGKHYVFGSRSVEVFYTGEEFLPYNYSVEALLENNELKERLEVIHLSDNEAALHYIDGNFCEIIDSGRHIFWKNPRKHEFRVVDISNTYVDESVAKIACKEGIFDKIEVCNHQKALLYFNKRFEKLLDAGTYYFWRNGVSVDVKYVDTRLIQSCIAGQEILTLDKVAVRVNLVFNYRITDYIKIAHEIDDYKEHLHVFAQLALREYVGKYRLDELLENKDAMGAYVLEYLKNKEKELYIEITDAGVKDIILPGEIREIMNTVLVAEKRAQANVITRREEVASTRSLLNTAKLMDENKTLYKLKELEFIEKICENVGNINLNGNGDVLSQLAGILNNRGKDCS